jgi:hypothetical protein
MRYAIRSAALTAALAIFLLGSTGTARADDGSPTKVTHPRLRVAFVPLGKLPPIPACT